MSTLGFIFMLISFAAWFCAGYSIGKNSKQPKQ